VRNTVRLAALGLSAIIASPSGSFTSCVQGNATGKWQAIVSVFGNSSGWITCALLVNSNGEIADTICVNNMGLTGVLTRGSLTLSHGPSCTFEAQFRLDRRLELAELAMARDKNTMTGVGLGPTASFVLNAVKVDAFPRSSRGAVSAQPLSPR
jgi:hypothetical protein